MVLRIEIIFERMEVPSSIVSAFFGVEGKIVTGKPNMYFIQTPHQLGESSVLIEMGDGDIELRIVRILLLHETMSNGNVSDGRYMKRENKTWPRTEPCGTPRVHLVEADLADWLRTHSFLRER